MVAMPRKYIPPNISTPVSWKYNTVCTKSLKHAQQRVMCGKHWIEQTPSLQDFCLSLIIPPESKYGPENKYLFRR